MSRLPKSRALLSLVLVLGLSLAACGSDDGAGVTVIGTDEASGSSASGSSASGSSASGSTASGSTASDSAASGSTASGSTASSPSDATCEPVNPELESSADTTLSLVAQDYAYEPAELTAPSGTITFTMANEGQEVHELAFLPGGGDVPFVDGAPDEAALEAAGAFELEGFGPGETCQATYELDAGDYTIFCIIQTAEGVTHYELGMRGTVTIQ